MMKLQEDLSLKYLEKKSKHKNPRLMLLLHGYGSNEEDLFSFAHEIPEDFTVVSLRAPLSLSFGGYAWYDINFIDINKFNNTLQAKESIVLIQKFIKEYKEKNNLTRKVWLCGFSQGAILSNALTIQAPQEISKVIMLSGYWAEDMIGPHRENDYGAISYFISHGIEDAVIPIDWARETPVHLESLGIKHQYEEYQAGHGISPQNFYDMIHWIEQYKEI